MSCLMPSEQFFSNIIKSYISIDDDDVLFVLHQQVYLDFYRASSQSLGRHVTSLQLILIGSLYAPYLVLSREEQIPIFIVVGLTQDDHNKCYTTDTIQI